MKRLKLLKIADGIFDLSLYEISTDEYIKSLLGNINLQLHNNNLMVYLCGTYLYEIPILEITDTNGLDTSNYNEEDFYNYLKTIF